MRIISFLILFTLLFSRGYSQIDDDDYSFFGLTRSVPIDIYDFGTVTSQKAEGEFIYVNTSENIQRFIAITPIEGIAVILEKTEVMPKESIKIHIILDRTYFKYLGDFKKNIGFKLIEQTNYGIKIQKQFYYIIKGTIQ